MTAEYYMLGLSKVVMGRLRDRTYESFNRRTGEWMESSYAFDNIVMGYIEPISKAEVERRVKALFPDMDMTQWF